MILRTCDSCNKPRWCKPHKPITKSCKPCRIKQAKKDGDAELLFRHFGRVAGCMPGQKNFGEFGKQNSKNKEGSSEIKVSAKEATRRKKRRPK